MKQILYIFLQILCLAGVPTGFAACSNDEGEEQQPASEGQSFVYPLRLEASVPSFEPASRATQEWQEGSTVYLRFLDGEDVVTGVATYDATKQSWTIVTQKALTAISGQLTAYYFENPSSATSTNVTLTTASVVYADEAATFEVNENVVTVRASLFPLTGRLRLQGSQGQSYGLSGLSHYTSYNVSTGQFNHKAQKLTGTIAPSGTSDFFYTFFTDEAALVFDLTATASFKATALPAGILAPGTSGYLTIPTASEPGNWVLVNSQNGLPITLPQIGAVDIPSVRSTSATIEARLTSDGNGKISAAGVLYSTAEQPTTDNGTFLTGSIADGKLSLRITGLTPQTRYYLKVQMTNEKGTASSQVYTFTTISKEDDGTFVDRDDFGEDQNLDAANQSEGNITKDDFSNDENYN